MRKILILFIAIAFALPVYAQIPSSVLGRDSSHHYVYMQTAFAEGVSKDVLYSRLKTWVMRSLDPSDSYLHLDESGHESIETMAYMEMPNSPHFINQFVNFRVALHFAGGKVTLSASDFIFHGTGTGGTQNQDVRLDRSTRLGDRESYVMGEFDGYFKNLMQGFEAAATGRKMRR